MKKGVWISVVIVVMMAGCDSLNIYYYNVVNNSDKKLRISYTHYKVDTVVYVGPNEKYKLLEMEIIGGRYISNPERNTSIMAIPSLVIFKNDSVLVNKDFLSTNRWKFIKLGDHVADFNLTVENQDLQ